MQRMSTLLLSTVVAVDDLNSFCLASDNSFVFDFWFCGKFYSPSALRTVHSYVILLYPHIIGKFSNPSDPHFGSPEAQRPHKVRDASTMVEFFTLNVIFFLPIVSETDR